MAGAWRGWAGVRRWGWGVWGPATADTREVLPAVGQGAIGITCRTGDIASRQLLAKIHDAETAACVAAERGLLEVLDGSCRTPIAALAAVEKDGTLGLDGLLARPDGTEILRVKRAGKADKADQLGRDAGQELAKRAGLGFIDW